MKEQHPVIQRVAALFGWTKPQLEAAKAVLAFAARLEETRGGPNTVAYLKEALRCFQKGVAGQPVREAAGPSPIGLDKAGYPKLLPRVIRRAATEGAWLERAICVVLLSLYREIVIPGKLKLWTITRAPSRPVSEMAESIRWDEAVTRFVDLLRGKGYPVPSLDVLVWKGPHVTNKKGPNGPAMLCSHLDAYALESHPRLWETFQTFVAHLVFDEDVDHRHPVWHVRRLAGYVPQLYESALARTLKVGRISAKLEAAGKVRLFAIPDYWTQSVLRPLHTHFYDVLRLLPTDSTFNQQAGVERALQAARAGVKHFWSFDLSAATDRFPLPLQTRLVEGMFADVRAKAFSEAWAKLLTDRDYHLGGDVQEYLAPEELNACRKDLDERPVVRYATGQPMGAYSSWATFALAHHCLVQQAAYLAWEQMETVSGPFCMYEDYALLGDDIVLWGDSPYNAKVAAKYLDLCSAIGVEINLEKSLVSASGAFEFAKNLVALGARLTPFHWKEWDRAFGSEVAFADFIKLMIHRGVVVTPLRAVLTYLGANKAAPRGLNWKNRPLGEMQPWFVPRLVILLFAPLGPFPMTVKSWCEILSKRLSDFGDTNVAWSDYPWSGKHVATTAEEAALVAFDENHWQLRSALWEAWESAAEVAAAELTNIRLRHYQVIKNLLEDLMDRGYTVPRGEVLEALVSIHPIAVETNRILRVLWRDGRSFLYGKYADSGMQDNNWWLGEDLQETPAALSRMRAQRQALPIETFLKHPRPEVQVLSEPLLPTDEEVVQGKFRTSMLLKVHKLLGKTLADMDRLRNMRNTEQTRQGFVQPTTPSKSRVITTQESFELYEKAYGRSPFGPAVGVPKGVTKDNLLEGRRSLPVRGRNHFGHEDDW